MRKHIDLLSMNVCVPFVQWGLPVVERDPALVLKRLISRELDKRGRGRPRTRWRDEVERYMREGGVGWEAGRQLTRDRNEWRQFICGHPLGD